MAEMTTTDEARADMIDWRNSQIRSIPPEYNGGMLGAWDCRSCGFTCAHDYGCPVGAADTIFAALDEAETRAKTAKEWWDTVTRERNELLARAERAEADNAALWEMLLRLQHQWCASSYESERSCASDFCRCSCWRKELLAQPHRCGSDDVLDIHPGSSLLDEVERLRRVAEAARRRNPEPTENERWLAQNGDVEEQAHCDIWDAIAALDATAEEATT